MTVDDTPSSYRRVNKGEKLANYIIGLERSGVITADDIKSAVRRLVVFGYEPPGMDRLLKLDPNSPLEVRVGDFILEPRLARLYVPKKRAWVDLQPNHTSVLMPLMLNTPNPLTHGDIINLGGLNEELQPKNVRPLVCYIRKRMGEETPPVNLISVWGAGYAFVP